MAEIREPQKSNSIEKKRKIVEGGLKVFGEKGFYKTTTVEIAKVAGVSTGIVYSYFKDKKDIFLHALRLYFGNIYLPMEQALQSVEPPIDLENTVRAFIQITIRSHKENMTAHEEMIAMSHLDEDVHKLFMDVEREITATVAHYLRANGFDNGNLQEKTHIAYNLVETLCHEYVYHRHSYIDYDVMIEETVGLLVSLLDSSHCTK